MKVSSFLLSLAATLLFVSRPAAAQNDFDADGISDFTWTIASTTLTWKTANSTASTGLNAQFGLATDFLALSHWEGGSSPNLGVVRPSTDSKSLTWKILLSNETIDQRTFGKPGDLVITGADFDGNGVTDAAFIRFKNKDIVWSIQTNIFTETNKVKRIKFGTLGDRVFFVNPDGDHDWLGIFGRDARKRVRCQLKDPLTGQIRKIKGLPKAFTSGDRPRPFAIRSADGTDAIGFVTQDETDTTLSVYGLDGSVIRKVTFPGLGSVAVGEYNAAQAGNEVIIQTTTDMFIYNPFTAVLAHGTVRAGAPVDETNIGNVPSS